MLARRPVRRRIVLGGGGMNGSIERKRSDEQDEFCFHGAELSENTVAQPTLSRGEEISKRFRMVQFFTSL